MRKPLNFLTQKISPIYCSPAILSRDPIIIFKKKEVLMKRVIFTSLLVAVFVFSGFATSHAAGKVLHIYEAFDTEEAKYYID